MTSKSKSRLSESQRQTANIDSALRKKLKHEARLEKKARHMQSRAARGKKPGSMTVKAIARVVKHAITPFVVFAVRSHFNV
jgi:hypothetical protein